MDAKITLEGTGCCFRWTCDVCGEIQGKDGMKSIVEYDGETFDICRACLQAGPDGAIKRGAEHADRLQEYVDALRVELPEVIHNITEWKTGKDYDAAIDEFNRAFEEECARDEGLTVEVWRNKYFPEPVVIDKSNLAWEDEFPF